jgi:hypothetical protein
MRHLLDETKATDARAVYYALQYADGRTHLVTYRPNAPRAIGYVCQSRTGYDLFRPIVTMRLPIHNLDDSAAILRHGLTPGMPVILNVPEAYMPLVSGLFDVYAEESYRVLVLDRGRFRPIINVLVTHETAANGLPSCAILRDDERVTSASINWQINHFAEIALTTAPATQRAGWTESVLAALSGHIVDNGRTPIVSIADHETGALEAAKSIGFVDLGIRDYLVEATLLP